MLKRSSILVLTVPALWATDLEAQQQKPLPGSEECQGCHETGRRTGKREAGMPPPFDAVALQASPHRELECSGCHADLAGKEMPHPEKLAHVECGTCHPDEQSQYDVS